MIVQNQKSQSIYSIIHPFLDNVENNWLLFKIQNVNLIIKKIHFSSGVMD